MKLRLFRFIKSDLPSEMLEKKMAMPVIASIILPARIVAAREAA